MKAKSVLLASVLSLSFFALGANLKDYRSKATFDEITIKSPDGTNDMTIGNFNGRTGIWIGQGNESLITLQRDVRGEAFVGIFNPNQRDGCNLALSVGFDGTSRLQIIDENRNYLSLTAKEITELAKYKTIHLSK